MFHLKVQRIHQACLFELSWGTGQHLTVTLDYPESLTTLYQEWQQVYLSFYKTALRGRVIDSDTFSLPVDWHAKLVQAEAKLLYEFHRWLRSAELFEIRAIIAKAAAEKVNDVSGKSDRVSSYVNLFLTCNPIELERFPWEAWEISTEFANAGSIHIIRTPLNIRGETVTQKDRTRRRKGRVLAILGDDTGLNFKADREAVRSLSRVMEVPKFVGWQPGKSATELKAEICNAIADEQGWDILFFAGHSNETNITGGELMIAPGVSMLISEIAPYLTKAKERGLQFAIFNSCWGLSIANALIDLGLSQVAVMREPIHNKVAEEFILQFLQSLAQYKDVHESMLAACQYLKLEKNFTYPSAHLIPSLYYHSDTVPFRLEPFGWKHRLIQWLPKTQEAIALSSLLFLSVLPSVQDFLLEQRILVQAVYRRTTNQISQIAQPPVLLVQIDEQSIKQAKISEPVPMDRKYLASLVDRLSALNAKVIGIDYLLDRPQKNNDRTLTQSLQAAVKKRGTWFVFVQTFGDTGERLTVMPEIASPHWSLSGDMGLIPWYMKLVTGENDRSHNLPFSYVLALAYKQNFQQDRAPLLTQLQSEENFLNRVKTQIQHTQKRHHTRLFPPAAHLQPITAFSYTFKQLWLHPILDFSIPPHQIYDRIPAWQLLSQTTATSQLQHLQQQVVMIVPGGYGEAGVAIQGEDNFPLPAAISYWRKQYNPSDTSRVFTGGEAHAYMVHHYVTGRLTIPIPDLWMLGVAGLLGKGTALALERQRYRPKQWAILLICTTAVYGLASLQIYISAAVLLPWLLPSATFWTYMLPALIRRK